MNIMYNIIDDVVIIMYACVNYNVHVFVVHAHAHATCTCRRSSGEQLEFRVHSSCDDRSERNHQGQYYILCMIINLN